MDKGLDWQSCNKLIEYAFDRETRGTNLWERWSARGTHWPTAQTVVARIFGSMKSLTGSGGRIDASETTLYLSRTRQGIPQSRSSIHVRFTRQLQNTIGDL